MRFLREGIDTWAETTEKIDDAATEHVILEKKEKKIICVYL